MMFFPMVMKYFVRFQVLTAAVINMAVFWVVVQCRVVKFTDVSELLAVSIIKEVGSASETSVSLCLSVYTAQQRGLQLYLKHTSTLFAFFSELLILL
jgi:hypothetical protein